MLQSLSASLSWTPDVGTAAIAAQKRLIGRTVVLLTLIVAAATLCWNNQIAQFAILIVLAVVIHEFAHAFQAKAEGQKILGPVVAMLPLRVTGVVGLLLIGVGGLVYEVTPATGVWMTVSLSFVVAGILATRVKFGWNPVLLKLPLGVGMHIEHTHRSTSDILAGSITEACFWLLVAVCINPLFIWMAPLTLLVNLTPIKIGGEGSDGMCALKEHLARRRGDLGATVV